MNDEEILDSYANFCNMLNTEDNIQRVCEAIESHPDYATKLYLGGKRTLLHAVYDSINPKNAKQYDERLPVIQQLLDSGADINAEAWYVVGIRPMTPLLVAIDKQQLNGIKLLLDNGASLTVTYNNRTYTALNLATSNPSISAEIVNLLLSYGADPNAYDQQFNETPVSRAARENRFDIVRILVDAGGHVNPTLRYGESPLLWAFRNENEALIEFLANCGVSVDMNNQYLQLHTPLHALAYARDSYTGHSARTARVVAIMQAQGVDLNAKNYEQNTALHIACEKEDEIMVEVLMSRGAQGSVNVENREGRTPLHLLLRSDKSWQRTTNMELCRIAKLLIDAGAILTIRDKFGVVPLHLATKNNHIGIVNSILSAVSQLPVSEFSHIAQSKEWNHLSTMKNETMCELSVAVLLNYCAVVDRLLEMGHLNEANQDGCLSTIAPMDCVLTTNHLKIGKLLLEAGCQIRRHLKWHKPSKESLDDYWAQFKLFSLVFIYSEPAVLRQSLLAYFKYAPRENNFLKIWGQFLVLIVFYYAISLRLDKNDATLMMVDKIVTSNEYLMPIWLMCESKLDTLTETMLYENISLFDVVSMKMESLVELLNSDELFKACQDLRSTLDNKFWLDYDEYLIRVRIDVAIEKKMLYDSTKAVLNSCVKDLLNSINYDVLPDHVLLKIMTYLSVRDLKKISADIRTS